MITTNDITLEHSHICNLSSRTLTPKELDVLSRGLGYAPSSQYLPDITIGIPKLTRDYRLRHYFAGQSINRNNNKPPPFRKASKWNPPKADADTETFLSSLPEELGAVRIERWRKNLSKAEWRALQSLKNYTDIVINKADKGSKIVVQNKADYVKEGEEHLSDPEVYSKLQEDPTSELSEEINRFIKGITRRGLLQQQMADYLMLDVENVRTQRAYFLKKLHKNPPGIRPIISGCNGPTEKLSSLIDYFIQPLVQKTKSYIRDSKALVNIIEKLHPPTNALLVTIDVKALYPSIPQVEGIRTAGHFIDQAMDSTDELPFTTHIAMQIMSIVCEHNYFVFNGHAYRQVRGTAMGTKMAPAFAGLFMAKLEEDFLSAEPIQPLTWLRYIDDIFCVWPGTREELNTFLTRLNAFHPTISFTFDINEDRAVFLDLEIYKGNRHEDEGILDLKPHFKATNSFMYLHHRSAHPPSTHRGVVKGEYIRILRASSSELTFQLNKEKLKHHFTKRGYSKRTLDRVNLEVPFSHRETHLLDKENEDENPPIIQMKYNSRLNRRDLHTALTPAATTVTRPMVCYTRGKTVRNHLVRALLPGTSTPPASSNSIQLTIQPSMASYSTPCSEPLCGCCSSMSKKERVYGKNGRGYSTAINTNCDTQNCIYLLECPLCPSHGRYVGQTSRPMRTRLAGHRAAETVKNMPLYKHSRKEGHGICNMKVTILEGAPIHLLLHRELTWMTKLDTILPAGLNSMYS